MPNTSSDHFEFKHDIIGATPGFVQTVRNPAKSTWECSSVPYKILSKYFVQDGYRYFFRYTAHSTRNWVDEVDGDVVLLKAVTDDQGVEGVVGADQLRSVIGIVRDHLNMNSCYSDLSTFFGSASVWRQDKNKRVLSYS